MVKDLRVERGRRTARLPFLLLSSLAVRFGQNSGFRTLSWAFPTQSNDRTAVSQARQEFSPLRRSLLVFLGRPDTLIFCPPFFGIPSRHHRSRRPRHPRAKSITREGRRGILILSATSPTVFPTIIERQDSQTH